MTHIPKPPSPISLTIEELTWLEASAILDKEPSSSLYDVDRHRPLSLSGSSSKNFRPRAHDNQRSSFSPTSVSDCPVGSTSSRILYSGPPRFKLPPSPTSSPSRSEWIYRRPNRPSNHRTRSATASSSPSHPCSHQIAYYGSTHSGISHISSNSDVRTTETSNDHTSVTTPIWSTILRARSRSERSMPLLKTIPSQTQISITPPFTSEDSSNPSTQSMSSVPSPQRHIRSPSITSLSSTSSITSHSSFRLETPTSPSMNIPSTYRYRHRQYSNHRRHATHPNYDSKLPPLSGSCPSKSILTRTSSISTKNSTSVSNKSVKFVEIPTVHYASAGYWDLKTLDSVDMDDMDDASATMGIDLDTMDMCPVDGDENHRIQHGDGFALDLRRLRDMRCETPTPEKVKGFRRFITSSLKSSDSTATTGNSSVSSRPSISRPYALGAFPNPPSFLPMSPSALSLQSHLQKEKGGNLALTEAFISTSVPLRSAPSLESFKSAKSSGSRSLRSMESLKSTASVRKLRAWLNRTGIGNGWLLS